jgi:PIN domain nuclease of toxin-antitoxin system
MIIATALSLGATIVTKDSKISSYAQVQTVW